MEVKYMRIKFKRLGALFLCGVMFTLAGCSDTKKVKETAKGRYVEGDFSIPSDIKDIYAMEKLEDNSILLVGDSENAALEVYSSKNDGKSFEKTELKPSVLPADNKISSLAVDKKGNMVVAYGVPEKAEGGAILSAFKGSVSYIKVDAAGKATLLNIALPSSASKSDGWANGLKDLKFAPNGDIFGMDNSRIIYQVDSVNGKIKNTYSASDINEYGIVKNTLLIVTNKKVEQYDITSAAKQKDAEVLKEYLVGDSSKNKQILLISGNKDNELYFCSEKGLYRYVLGGNVVEQMVEGSLTSLGSSSTNYVNMIVKADSSFLVTYKDIDSKYFLKNYSFSKDTPAAPGNEITVYSLKDNTTVRQQITKFQAANPDIHVVFQAGMTGKDAVSASDAIKTLNTEILAGKGPDVLILDGMPVESYVEKGLLADISDVVKGYNEKNELFKNIVEAYKDKDKIYAAPLRFKIPIINAHQVVLNQITDLETMADFAESYREKNPKSGDIAFAMDSKMLLQVLYPVISAGWFKSNGTFDDNKLMESITELKRINDAVMKIKNQEQDEDNKKKAEMAKGEDAYVEAFNEYEIEKGLLQINMGKISTFTDIARLSSSNKKDSTISYKLLSENNHYFSASTTVGMNSKTKSKENAKKFISYLFSEDAQAIDYTGGYPVNKKAFTAAQAKPSQKTMNDINLGRASEDRITWPSKEQFENFTALVETLDTPTFEDKVIFDTVSDEFEKCASGKESVEDTVKNLKNRLNIYLSE